MPYDDREKRRAYARQYYQQNKDKWVRARAKRTPAQRDRHNTYMRDYQLRRAYGITHDVFERMLCEQAGVCAICGQDKPAHMKNLHVDHCHATGTLRGLLCDRCNMALGWFEKYQSAVDGYLGRCL